MPDDHSELVPLLPIPNRTVKQLRADDSAGSRVKVGHRQALTALKTPSRQLAGVLSLERQKRTALMRQSAPAALLPTPSPNTSSQPKPLTVASWRVRGMPFAVTSMNDSRK